MRKLVVVAMLLASVAYGCGGADDVTVPEGPGASAEETAEPTEQASHSPTATTFTDSAFELEVRMDDFWFDPTTVKAPGGSTATLRLRNVGETAHTFTIDALDVDESLEAGAVKEIELELGTETRYEYYCRFHLESHDMQGSFSLH